MVDSNTTRQQEIVRRAIAKNSFCTLATSSAENRPHVAGVLYVNTTDSSIKVRNIRKNPRVAVSIPVKRYPLLPPFLVQFRGRADVFSADDTEIVALVKAGRLKKISSHGELDKPGSCFIRPIPARRVTTFGVGVPLRQLMRDPLNAGGSVELS